MPDIESKEFWDLRDLAELATECGDVLEDEDADEDDKQDAREVLTKLSKLADDLNQSNDEEDAASVAEALEEAMNTYGPTLVSESYFPEYVEEFVTDCGYLPAEVPWWLSNNINWDGVADALKVDYTCVTFDGEEWYIR